MFSLENRFNHKKTLALASAAAFFVVVVVTDANTSVELSLTLFYLATVLVVTWNCGLGWGLLFAAVSATAQIVFGLFIGNPYSRPVYFYVDTITRVVSYLLVLFLTAQLRRLHDRAQVRGGLDLSTRALTDTAFADAVQAELGRSGRENPVSVACFDCDRFHAFNQTFGRSVGDQVLCAIVVTAKAMLTRKHLIGRLGGHEFAVLLPDIESERAADEIRFVRRALNNVMAEHGWDVRFNFGFVTFIDEPSGPSEALSICRSVMHDAAAAGTDRFVQRQFRRAISEPQRMQVGQ